MDGACQFRRPSGLRGYACRADAHLRRTDTLISRRSTVFSLVAAASWFLLQFASANAAVLGPVGGPDPADPRGVFPGITGFLLFCG